MSNISKSSNKKIAKNTLYMYIRMAITIVIGLYTSRVVLNTLGVSDYGIYNVVGGIVSLFIFLNSALSQATQRFMAFELGRGEYDKLKKTFGMCLNVHVIIACAIVFLGETIGLWLVYNKLVIPDSRFNTALWVYQFSILASVISITQVPYNASINAHEKFNVYAVVSIFDALLRLSIVLCLPYLKGDLLLWYGILIFGANLAQAIIYRAYCNVKFDECKYQFVWDKFLFKKIFGYTSWSLLGNIADTLADQGVNILLNMFFGPAVNAARGIALHVKSSVAGFVYNFQGAANPQIVKRYASNEFDSMVNLVIKTSKISFFLFLLVMLPICIEINTILTFWLGNVPDYLPIFSIVTLTTVLLQSMGGTLQASIQASGNIKLYQILVGLTKLLTVPLCYIGLKVGLNPVYPFLVVMTLYGGVVWINLYIVKKVMQFPSILYIRKVIGIDLLVFAVSIFIALLLMFFFRDIAYRCFITIPSSFISVALVSYSIGFNNSEKGWIKRLIISKFQKK